VTVPRGLRRVGNGIAFIGFFTWELILANMWVAWEIITPRFHMRPGIIRVPIRAETDVEIMLLANLISFTPGTLSLEVDDDRTALYVHGLNVSTPERFREQIAELEDHLLKVTR
jgi:multicomponent Na+:H+ antiporter subunit E